LRIKQFPTSYVRYSVSFSQFCGLVRM
jgi:hypothetical protein